MKPWGPLLVIALVFGGVLTAVVASCGSDALAGRLNGSVQKGPFIRGSTLTIQELDSQLRPTGRSYTVATTDDLGTFSLDTVSSPFVELIATGYYFDELSGTLSVAPLTLRAISDVSTGRPVRVNILTNLEGTRLRALVGQGLGFDEARAQAEGEVLAILGLAASDGATFDRLDVSQAGDDNARLLAASLLLAEAAYLKRPTSAVAALSELLASVEAAVGGGALGPADDDLIHCAAPAVLDVVSASAHLQARFAELGLQATVPDARGMVRVAPNCGGTNACVPMHSDTPLPDGGVGGIEIPVPPGQQPVVIGLVPGSANDVWFTDRGNNRIGHLYPVDGGLAVEEPDAGPSTFNQLEGITLGADGNVWFTAGTRIGRMTAQGVITEFTVPTPSPGLLRIARGYDDNLWFTESYANQIGVMSTAGAVLREIPIPTAQSNPTGIARGPNGHMWFLEGNGNKVAEIDDAGSIKEYAIPTPNSSPAGLVLGPDGNVWFTESGASKVGRLTPLGVFTEFSTPTANSSPQAITLGPDCNLWYAGYYSNALVRVRPDGTMTEYPLPVDMAYPQGVVGDSHGNIWSSGGGQIGHLTP